MDPTRPKSYVEGPHGQWANVDQNWSWLFRQWLLSRSVSISILSNQYIVLISSIIYIYMSLKKRTVLIYNSFCYEMIIWTNHIKPWLPSIADMYEMNDPYMNHFTHTHSLSGSHHDMSHWLQQVAWKPFRSECYATLWSWPQWTPTAAQASTGRVLAGNQIL